MNVRSVFRGTRGSVYRSVFIKCLVVTISLTMLSGYRPKHELSVPESVANQGVFRTLRNSGFGGLIYPVTSVVPTGKDDDLNSISPFISNRSIVALGESTHGTSEFYTLRLRLIQYMVTKLNFRVIGLEANFSNAQSINDYILGGSGNAKDAVQKLYGWVYNNQEFVQIVEWLRSYNDSQTENNKVTFYGFDAQSAEAAAKRTQVFISDFAPHYLAEFDSLAEPFLNDFQEIASIQPDALVQLMPVKVGDYQSRWNAIKSYFEANKNELILRSSIEKYELSMRHWEIVQQTFNSFLVTFDEAKSNNLRDHYMADNVDWIQQFERNRKMILMAHVGHVSLHSDFGITPMGKHLRQRHQDDYYTVGLFTNGGEVRVVNMSASPPVLGELKIDPKPKHALTQAFAKGKWSQFFLPMSAVNQNSDLKSLFNRPNKFYYIGSTNEKVTIEQNLAADYDAIIFIEKTSATRPN